MSLVDKENNIVVLDDSIVGAGDRVCLHLNNQYNGLMALYMGLEKDYGELGSAYEEVKASYDSLKNSYV